MIFIFLTQLQSNSPRPIGFWIGHVVSKSSSLNPFLYFVRNARSRKIPFFVQHFLFVLLFENTDLRKYLISKEKGVLQFYINQVYKLVREVILLSLENHNVLKLQCVITLFTKLMQLFRHYFIHLQLIRHNVNPLIVYKTLDSS